MPCNSFQETCGSTCASFWHFGYKSTKATTHIVTTFLPLDGAITGDGIHLGDLRQNSVKRPCMSNKVTLQESHTTLIDSTGYQIRCDGSLLFTRTVYNLHLPQPYDSVVTQNGATHVMLVT
jgi:hypothetical protein